MDPDISEFSYGFALTSELVARFGLKRAGAPEFATQHAEAKKGGGWDMKLPALPIFLQFKRSDPMVRNTAQEARAFSCMPFFRMYLRRRIHSNQHQLLLELEKEGNLVLYAAPGFSKPSELNAVYSADRVAVQSIFVRPSAIGPLSDDEKHWVAFQVVPRLAYWCSEPKRIVTETVDSVFGTEIRERAVATPQRAPDAFFFDVAEQLLQIYERRASYAERGDIDRIRALRQRREPQDFAGLVARTLFDCELLIYPRD